MSHDRDFLSGMPDDILRHILSFLPTDQSVRTSVLSRRWRHLWRCVPTLHFDIADHPKPSRYDELMISRNKMIPAIGQFVALRDASAPLFRFHLRLVVYGIRTLENPVSNWVRYARPRGVRNMTMYICWRNGRPPVRPVSMIFDLPSVETLQLLRVSSILSCTLPQQIALSKLKSLNLNTARMQTSDQCLTTLLSSCPALQDLILYYGIYNEALEITVPNLRRLTMEDCAKHKNYSCQIRIACPKLEELYLSKRAHINHFQGHMPSLLEAYLDLCYLHVKPRRHFLQIFMTLRSVTKLALYLRADSKSNSRDLLKLTRTCPIFHKLKQFSFKACLRQNYFKTALLDFLWRSPNLFSLKLVDDTKEGYSPEGRAKKVQTPATLKVLDHLKIVCRGNQERGNPK